MNVHKPTPAHHTQLVNTPKPKTLSPIPHNPTRSQRTPPLSGIFLIKPPSPWAPSTTPPRILGHHIPTINTPTPHDTLSDTQHRYTSDNTLTLNDQSHPHTPISYNTPILHDTQDTHYIE